MNSKIIFGTLLLGTIAIGLFFNKNKMNNDCCVTKEACCEKSEACCK